MLINPYLRIIDFFYSLILSIGNNLQSLFLLYMRLTWGHQFFINGLKHSGFTSSLELVGGVLLIVGLASRLIAIPLIILTLLTLGTANASEIANLRFITEPLVLVKQQPYPFLITSILIFVFGPGRLSIDAWIKHWVSGQPRY